jgi:hypothetical protein
MNYLVVLGHAQAVKAIHTALLQVDLAVVLMVLMWAFKTWALVLQPKIVKLQLL